MYITRITSIETKLSQKGYKVKNYLNGKYYELQQVYN